MTELPPSESDRSPLLAVFVAALRRWPLRVALAAAGGGGGYLGFTCQSPVFESSARLQVSKRGGTGDGRDVHLQDYVATMTQLIASDAVLDHAGRTLAERPLAAPLPEDETPRIDALKRALAITHIRYAGAVTSTSSVLSLKFTGATPDDTRLALDAVLEAVRWYLVTRYDDAHALRVAELDRTIAARADERRKLEETQARRMRELAEVTEEELTVVRDRLAANAQRSFALQLELISLDRELKLIAEVGATPEARLAKLRVLRATPADANAPVDAPSRGPAATLRELVSGRAELAEHLIDGHPRLVALDEQIEKYRKLVKDVAPTGEVDELSRHEARVRERKAVAELQRDRIEARVVSDSTTLRHGGAILQAVDALQRQLEEGVAETNRLRDRRSALVLAKDSGRTYDVQVLDRPRSGRKVAPSLKMWLVFGTFFGLFAGVGGAFLVESRNQGYRTPDEIRQRLGVPVFGHIPTFSLDHSPTTVLFSDGFDPTLVTAVRPMSIEAEMYRGLRTRVLVASTAAKCRVIQVTSPNPGDGKSTTAANLAVSLAQAGKRVSLIDADFRRPRVHTLFALANPELGLGGVLDGTVDLTEAVRPSGVDRLLLLPAGTSTENPADALAGARFLTALSTLRDRFDHVIIDSPPLFAFSDPLVIAQRADAVILVFGLTRRSRTEVERAKAHLSDTGAVVMGVVINGQVGARAKYDESYKPYAVSKTLRDFSGDGSGSLSGTFW